MATLNPSKSEVNSLPGGTEVTFLPMEAVSEDGEIIGGEVRQIGSVYAGYTYFRDGDVLIAKITPCFENGKRARAVGLASGIGFGTTEFHVIRPNHLLDMDFLFYLTSTDRFRKDGEVEMTGAAGQQRVPADYLRSLPLPLPPIDEQRAIVALLDRETKKIDALIAKQERFIRLLEEKRQAVIATAVNQGTDLNIGLKPTGDSWLGAIPRSWSIKRLKFTAYLNKEKLDEDTPINKEIDYVEISDVAADKGLLGFLTLSFGEAPSRARRVVRAGDTIVSTVRTYLRAIAYLSNPSQQMVVSTGFTVVRPTKEMIPKFLGWALQSRQFVERIVSRSVGVSYPAIGPSEVGDIAIAVPPTEEQQKIAEFLDGMTMQVSFLIERQQAAIVLLRERRASLIETAVTGKIDVRDRDAGGVLDDHLEATR
ncbi:MAG: restriction endonuclease subunit S [Microbacteriaceae bacterium]|nr:restriction endonuclease subunit S [Microbacteriaceae bacterium]